MINKKYINMFAGGIIAIQLGNFGSLGKTVDLTLPTSTPSVTIKPLLINPNSIEITKSEFINKRGELSNVRVTSKTDTSITVDNGGTSVKVDFQSNTHFRRKFWGVSNINEISVGDTVNVVGRWTSDAKAEIKAVLIRNLSIQKRFGVFFGTVKSITDTGFVVTTIQRGDETVTLDSTTKLINRIEQYITTSEIQVGQRIRVRGLWDSVNFTITGVTEVKDFSLPPFASPTPTATP